MNNQTKFAIYVDSFRVTADAAPVVASQLQAAAPPDASPEEKKRLREIEVEGDHIASELCARERMAPAAVKHEKEACVGAWTGVCEIAGGKARLDPSSEQGAAAREIMKAFFQAGVPVSQRDAAETFGISSRLLQRVHDEKLAKTLELVVGADMVSLLKSTTDALGEAIGAGETPRAPAPSSNAVQEALARYSRKVAAYCRLLLARVDEDDPRSLERFYAAVAPIDAYRASARGGSDAGKDEDGDPPAAPSPSVAPGMPGGSPFVTT